MILTPQLKDEITRLMEDYWATYFKGDIERYGAYLARDFNNIGTTEQEIWHSKDEMIEFTRSILPETVGVAQLRNREVDVLDMDPYLMAHEFGDVYVKSGDTWEFYAKFRLSTVLKQVDGEWKVWHQHGSYPDARTVEDEPFGMDKIRAENTRLHQAVEQRTRELKQQSRELEIEASLERIRSRSMGMQRSDELKDVIEVIFAQLTQLNINADHAGIVVDYEPGADWTFWIADAHGSPSKVTAPFLGSVWDKQFASAKKEGSDFFTTQLNFEEKNRFYGKLLDYIPELTKQAREYYMNCPGLAISTTIQNDVGLYIENFEGVPFSDADNLIVRRFGEVLQQTYTRFLDLKKAEAQAREAQVEAALERVRAVSMAMNESSELVNVATIVYKQLMELGFDNVLSGGFNFPDHKENITKCWFAETSNKDLLQDFVIPLSGDPVLDERQEYRNKGIPFVEQRLNGEEVKRHMEFVFPSGNSTDEESAARAAMPDPTIFSIRFLNEGYMILISDTPLDEEQKSILERFASVFNLAHTRFLDLQKAEAQAREAQIEQALEKVRSSTMAMQSSSELAVTSSVLFAQIKQLGVKPWVLGFILPDDETYTAEEWMTKPNGMGIPEMITLPLDCDEVWHNAYKAWLKGENFLAQERSGDALVAHHDNMKKVLDIPFDEIFKEFGTPEQLFFYTSFFEHGYLFFITKEPHPEMESVFIRFTNVFDQTYTRFLDLQKSEAQAREAQIEVALERVRNRAMAMRSSAELADLVITVFRELSGLDMVLTRCLLWIFDPDDQSATAWMTNSENPGIADSYHVPYHDHPAYLSYLNAWEAREPKWEFILEGEVKHAWDDILVYGYFSSLPEEIKQAMKEPVKVILSGSFDTYGAIQTASLDPLSDENKDIVHRFSQVFEQSYTRFKDLLRAEAQARESQVEAALERVRSRTMGMQKSQELRQVANVLFQQVRQLDIHAWSAGYCIWDDDKNGITLYMSSEDVMQPPLWAPLDEDDSFRNFKAADERGDTFWVGDIGGEEIVEHYKYMYTLSGVGDVLDSIQDAGHNLPSFQVYHCVYFEHGFLLFITYEHVPESHELFKRFGNVFDQTYTRFLDLKLAETQAYQAQIETALERVRARALAMQEPEELKDVADVMRREMGALGVEELETSSIYINDKDNDRIECWYALKDIRETSSELVADNFELDLNDTWVGREMLAFYASDDAKTSIVMTGQNRIEWINYCAKYSPDLQGYYGEEIPDRTYHLYKFSHGAIGAASAGDISDESWELLQRAASVFSLAYSRFKDLTQARHDLQRLKEEKQRAESALKELKETQAQLVHAEKMASLGELTAGIAHEIKNPLNFVNNFSEVSNELLEELKEELEAGNYDEVSELVSFVTQNLEKIATHGKRADGIVKSMLQHSRSSTGQKESVDINALVDEYLRLAYHGLRAKDKSFNATFELHLDPSLGDVQVIRQEIGRVLLNLMNNAFYAVSEKAHTADDFKPTVSVTTKNSGSSVEIVVSDNGNGIPEELTKKIFQPFFTTKPTGEGTGLGLSLSYDIVKSHGGEMNVRSKEGNGTDLIINLPIIK